MRVTLGCAQGGPATVASKFWRPSSWLIAYVVVPAALGGLVYYQTGLFRAATGPTFDEPLYLKLGVEGWRTWTFGNASLSMPPALPLVLVQWLPAWYAGPDLDPAEILSLLPL